MASCRTGCLREVAEKFEPLITMTGIPVPACRSRAGYSREDLSSLPHPIDYSAGGLSGWSSGRPSPERRTGPLHLFPAQGNVLWGSGTSTRTREVNVRRFVLFIEQSLQQQLPRRRLISLTGASGSGMRSGARRRAVHGNQHHVEAPDDGGVHPCRAAGHLIGAHAIRNAS